MDCHQNYSENEAKNGLPRHDGSHLQHLRSEHMGGRGGEGPGETGLQGESQPKNRIGMYYIPQEHCPIKNVYVIHVYSK